MSNSPQQLPGLRYVKECNLVEVWHHYDYDDCFIFLREFNGVLCRVRIDEVVNDAGDYDVYVANRHDLGMNVDVRVHVYEDMLRNIRNILHDIESALRSASNMDVHYERGTLDKEQSAKGKRGLLEKAERYGYKAMQAIGAFKQNALEELLGVENGRRLFYAASAVRSRTYQALDGSQSIDDVRIFINELLALVGLPVFPTPPPAPERYAVHTIHDNPRMMKLKEFPCQSNDWDTVIRFIKDDPMNFGETPLLIYDREVDKSFNPVDKEWLRQFAVKTDDDDVVKYDTDDDGDSELLHWNGNDLVPPDMRVSPIVEKPHDWRMEGLENSLEARTQETYELRDEIKALKKQLDDLHNIGAEFEQFRTRYAQEWNEWKAERRKLIKDAFDAKYSLSLAEIELNKVKKDRDNLKAERDTARANYTMLEGEHEKLSDVFDQMQQQRDDWKLRCESAKLELIEAKRRADDARQETLCWKDAYAASEESNKKLFYQRHKLAKQLVRRRHPRVVTLLK